MAENTTIPSNSEIDAALKEFEEQSSGASQAGTMQVPQAPLSAPKEVEGIKFETDTYQAINLGNRAQFPPMVRLVMKFSGGAIKEQKTAEYVLLGIVVLNIILTIFVIKYLLL